MSHKLFRQRREVVVGGLERNETFRAVPAEPSQVVRPAKKPVPKCAGVIDDGGPRDKSRVVEWQCGLRERDKSAIEMCER